MTAKKKAASVKKSKNVGRKGKNTFTTKSGKTFKVNRSLLDRFKAKKAQNQQKKAERLAGMPKGRVKRFFWRLHPRQMYKYWFSREGGIMLLKLAGIGILVGFLILVGVFAYFRKDLPNITDVSGNNIGGSIQYFDSSGKVLLWEDFDAVKRIPIPGENISEHVKNATIAIEDQDFYEHGGFDVKGITRAGVNNLLGTGGTQGGSTITQQLVKLTNSWQDERTYTRKIKELILSVQLEREYTKEQILTGYLNTAPYGNIEYGVQAAANNYFQKDAKDLTISESAFLAAIPKSPSIYSPYGAYFDEGQLVGRYLYILDQMAEQGFITSEEANEAKEIEIVSTIKPQQPKYSGIKHPYFVLAAKSELDSRYGADYANRGGWKVITTVDTKLQGYAEEAIKDNMPLVRQYGGDVSAFVAEDVETGHIVALVGGADFNNEEHGKINYAHNAFIPPGSTFKPFDYAALIEYTETAGAGSVLYDQQGPLPGYPCTNKNRPSNGGNCLSNFDFRHPGPLTLRYALGGSRNIPAVKANLIAGTEKVNEMASKMMYNPNKPDAYQCFADENFTEVAPCYGASAIGDGAFLHLDDLVNGYATFSRLGEAIPRTYIKQITDATDQTIYEYERPRSEQVIRPDTAYIVNDMAADPNASYLPFGYKFHNYEGHRFAIKTGTTNDSYDGLMAAWSGKYATIAWVGHHTRTKALGGFMEVMTTPITRTWMEKAHKGQEPKNWVQPDGVKKADAYVVKTHVGLGSVEPSPKTDLYPSWYEPPQASNKTQRIDIISNKKATECTPEGAIKESKDKNSNTFSVDIFVDKANNTEEEDDVHECSDVKPSVTIIKNGDGEVKCDQTCTISARVDGGTHPLSSGEYKGTVSFSIGGETINSQTVNSDRTVSFTYNPTFSGTKTLNATIVDSVLYQGVDSAKIDAEQAPTASLSITKAEQDGLKADFKWSGTWNGIVRIYRASNDEELCPGQNKNDDDCSAAGLYEGEQVYAKDEDGVRSDNVTVE